MLKMALFSILMKLGVFRFRAVRAAMYRVYFGLKRKYFDIYYDLIHQHPELFRGGFILDVGANIGCTSYFFSTVISENYRVIAFEPAPENYILLQNCIASYHNEIKITAVNAAVGDHDGTIPLEINRLNHTAHRVSTGASAAGSDTAKLLEVPLIALDSYCKAHRTFPIKFVKIDVEGYELFVYRGMAQIIADNPELVIGLEFGCSSQAEVRDEYQLLEYLASQFLNLYTAVGGDLQSCSIDQLKRCIEQRETVDIIASKRDLIAPKANAARAV